MGNESQTIHHTKITIVDCNHMELQDAITILQNIIASTSQVEITLKMGINMFQSATVNSIILVLVIDNKTTSTEPKALMHYICTSIAFNPQKGWEIISNYDWSKSKFSASKIASNEYVIS